MKIRILSVIIMLLFSTLVYSQYSPEYAARKAAIAPERPKDTMLIEAHNDYIVVEVDEEDGQFYIGTWPEGKTLTYNFPDALGPWSSWTIIRAEETSFTMDPATGHGAASGIAPMTVIDPFHYVFHSGDSSYVQGTWTLASEIDITQVVMPIYLVSPTDTTGSIFIEYTIVNVGSACYDIGLLLQLDTMVDTNDGAPISTIFGYSGIEEDFSGPDSMPDSWHAYSHPDGPAYTGDQLEAMGILDGLAAEPPDTFVICSWPRVWTIIWDYTVIPSDYTDSAVLLRWSPREICPGETLRVATYYGLALLYGDEELRLRVPEYVRIDDPCDYTPDTFEAIVDLGNSGLYDLHDAYAVITLSEGLVLEHTDSDTHSFSPSSILSGGTGTTSWIIIADGSVSDTTFNVHVDAYYTAAGTTIVKSVDGYTSMGPIGFRADAELIDPLDGTRSTCPDQDITMNIIAETEVDPSSIEFVVNGVTYTVDDEELSFDESLLTFTPTGGFSDEEEITYSLTRVADFRGCTMEGTIGASFVMDLSGPVASNEFPPDHSIIATTVIPEFSIDIEDNITEIFEPSIEFEVNGDTYDLGDAALTWDGNTLHFSPPAAGIEIEEGDSFEVCLLSSTDMPPDYCEPNPLDLAPYCWEFLINIIDLWLPDTLGYLGDTILIPVFIEEVDQFEITSFTIIIEVSPGVLIPLGIETDGTITGDWEGILTDSIDGGIIVINGEGPELSGDSILFYIVYVVNPEGTEGSFSHIEFGELTFNEGYLEYRPENGFYYTLWTTPEWMIELIVTSPEADEPCSLTYGTSRYGDDNYNFGLDLTLLPSGQKVRAYFPLADRTFPYITKLQRDIRYYEDLPIIWEIEVDVEPDTASWTIEWEPSIIPEGEMIIYLPGELAIDMHTNNSISSIGDANVFIRYSQPEIRMQEIVFNPGWNLVSFPFVPLAGATFEEMFPGIFGNAYWYDPVSRYYVEETHPEAGKGYWLYAADTVSTRIAGMTILDFSVPVYWGFNLVGVPYASSGTVPCTGTFYEFTDTYEEVTWGYLTVGKGYWYWSDTSGAFNATSVSIPAKGLPYLGEPETIIPLEISKEGQFAEIFLGIDGEASEGSDGFDRLLPPLPPGETRPVSLTGLENYAKIDFERSVKPEVNSIQWEILTNTDVEIAWNPGNLPADYSFNIQSEGRTYSMNETIALAVPASQRILITAEKIVPSKATLLGNYPNPFNAQTTISFSLPARTEVDLSVFNLLGETVSGLFSGELEAGKHQTTWEGTNDQGASLPSGVYYYKLRVGEEEQVRKMLLVK